MKEISLPQGKIAIVDDWNYERLSNYTWLISTNGSKSTYYAIHQISRNNCIWMHHLILPPPPGFEIDHRDGNGWNNQQDNLRICTHSQNLMNQKPQLETSSIYKGVIWDKQTNKWRARIVLNRRNTHLGRFKSEKEAALAYNCAALQHFGEFARLNIIGNPVTREELLEKLIRLEKGERL